MAWVKLDDHFDENPKIAKVGPVGIAFYVVGLAYCNRNLTDGFIPWAIAQRLVPMEWIGTRGNGDAERVAFSFAAPTDERVSALIMAASDVIELLLTAGLWEAAPGGYMVHDYASFQPSRATVLAERDAARGRMAGARANKPKRSPELRPNFENVRPNFAGSSLYQDADPFTLPVTGQLPPPPPTPEEVDAAPAGQPAMDSLSNLFGECSPEVRPNFGGSSEMFARSSRYPDPDPDPDPEESPPPPPPSRGRGARAARLGAPEGETPLPRPGKTVETVEWKEVMRSEYAARLEDFEETWQFILGSSYLKKRDDRRSYIEGQLKNAAKRWAEKGKLNGRNQHDEPNGTRIASKFAAYG